MDEAPSFAVVSEILVHDAEWGANSDTEGAIDALERAWIQYFGYPLRLRCDLEGCFRGRGLEDYTASRGIELLQVPAEHHESTGDVERGIGVLRLCMEKFLKACGVRHDRGLQQQCQSRRLCSL